MTTETRTLAATMTEAARLTTEAGRPVAFRHDHSGIHLDYAAGGGHFYGFFVEPGVVTGWHTTDEGDCVGPIPMDYRGGVDTDDPADVAAAILAAIDVYRDHGGVDDAEGCPGCGNRPGQGITADCYHPLGCGFHRVAEVYDESGAWHGHNK